MQTRAIFAGQGGGVLDDERALEGGDVEVCVIGCRANDHCTLSLRAGRWREVLGKDGGYGIEEAKARWGDEVVVYNAVCDLW